MRNGPFFLVHSYWLQGDCFGLPDAPDQQPEGKGELSERAQPQEVRFQASSRKKEMDDERQQAGSSFGNEQDAKDPGEEP